MNIESNPRLLQLDQLEAARRKWCESEWLLNFLRSEGCIEPKTPSDQELLIWAQNLH
jgi:hypothetical protein